MIRARLPCKCGATVRAMIPPDASQLRRLGLILGAYWRHFLSGGHA